MTQPISHAIDPEKLSNYLDDALDDAEREMVEEHLAGCAECREHLADYLWMGERIRAIESRPVPLTLDGRVADILMGRRERSVWRFFLFLSGQRPAIATALVAAVLSVVVLFGLFGRNSNEPMVAAAYLYNDQGETAIAVDFSYPVDRAKVEKTLKIEPEVEATVAWRGDTMVVKPIKPLQPETSYTVRINPMGSDSAATPVALPVLPSKPTPTPPTATLASVSRGSSTATPTNTPLQVGVVPPTGTPSPTSKVAVGISSPTATVGGSVPNATSVANQGTSSPTATASPTAAASTPTMASVTATPARTMASIVPTGTPTLAGTATRSSTSPVETGTPTPSGTPSPTGTVASSTPTAAATPTADSTAAKLTATPPAISATATTPTAEVSTTPTATPGTGATTPTPAITPTVAATPRIAATPTATLCATQPQRGFGIVYRENPSIAARLGCATTDELDVQLVRQGFQNGLMFQRPDTKEIIALRRDGRWFAYPDSWHAGDELADLGPAPAGMFIPEGAIGKVWRDQIVLQATFGWATALEQPILGVVQGFSGGEMLWTGDRVIYVLYPDGTWRGFADSYLPPTMTSTPTSTPTLASRY